MTHIDAEMFEIPKECSRQVAMEKGTAVVFIYTESDTEPLRDLRQQALKCFDFCAKNKLAVLKVFAERCSVIDRGRELSEAQSFCCENQVTYLVVDLLSRIANGVSDVERLEEAMKDSGTSLLAVKIPSGNANELSLFKSLSNAIRRQEKSHASERTKLGMQRATERGKICHRVPAGIIVKKQKTTLEYDPIRAPLIRMGFFMLFSQMFSITDIAKMLGKRGLVNEKTGKPYTARTMKRILSNPIYAGEMPGPDRYFFRPEGLNPLIEKILFDEVQAILEETKDNPLRTRNRPSSGESGDEWLAAAMGM